MRTGIAVFAICAVVFLGCGTETPDPAQTVIDNYRALDEEDIDLYMSTVSGRRADIAGAFTESLFTYYEVSYKIDSVEVLSKVGNHAQVRSVVTTRDEGGPRRFHHMRVVSLHKLHFENEKWRIYYTETEKPVILEKVPRDTIPVPATDTIATASISKDTI